MSQYTRSLPADHQYMSMHSRPHDTAYRLYLCPKALNMLSMLVLLVLQAGHGSHAHFSWREFPIQAAYQVRLYCCAAEQEYGSTAKLRCSTAKITRRQVEFRVIHCPLHLHSASRHKLLFVRQDGAWVPDHHRTTWRHVSLSTVASATIHSVEAAESAVRWLESGPDTAERFFTVLVKHSCRKVMCNSTGTSPSSCTPAASSHLHPKP